MKYAPLTQMLRSCSGSLSCAHSTLDVVHKVCLSANQTASPLGCEISIFICAGADTYTHEAHRETAGCCGLAAEEQDSSSSLGLFVRLAAPFACFEQITGIKSGTLVVRRGSAAAQPRCARPLELFDLAKIVKSNYGSTCPHQNRRI